MSAPTTSESTQDAARAHGSSLQRLVGRHSWALLINADCLDVLPTLDAGLVYVTDQPYGTGFMKGGGKKAGEFKWDAMNHEKPEWDVWNLAWLEKLNAPKRVAAFCPVGKCEELCNALPQPTPR